ncbi:MULTISPECIES: ABC transporter ATP-binding protein [unclassified Ensifer]|uniref:ABC transporter ATP-binding protein n=1 Tax=unclassified Ensifer TaxID=2633371 RepID=UPI000713C732|nr:MULTISPECIES: ABC transporter ATP-binding protein [unclassified Ensifer]KQX55890.1 ABC transporter [Ensifer sp. Root1298]KQX91723.1 ABC transporter [Ensifer sp. Root1312]KRC26715.1 ABC transporter [Ensifer sp. Root74]KRD71855.1 ABC transporter [Ensifer sp. Root954]
MTLDIRDLAFGYGGRTVGENASLSLESGEVLALLGPNGAGKTTLFKTVLGLLPVKAGDILLDGRPLSAWSRRERARQIAYVPQAHAALFPFTVLEVVLMGRAARLAPFSSPGARDRRIAMEALGGLGVAHLAMRPYTEISGGERQMALIARALTQEPAILVMDEPTANLDYGNQMRVLSHVRALAARGLSVVLSTHNPDHAFLVADRVALLHASKLSALGLPKDVLTPASLKQLYDIDVVIGSIDGSDARLCAPRLTTPSIRKGTDHGPPERNP